MAQRRNRHELEKNLTENDLQTQSQQMFTPQGGIDSENTHLLEIEREQRLLVETLSRVGLALTSVLDLPTLLDLICQEGINLFKVGAAYIWLVQENELVGFAGQGHGREEFIGLRVPLSDPVTLGPRVIREKRPIFVNEALNSNEVNQKLTQLLQIKALLGVPLLKGDKAVGALMISDTDHAERFGPEDVKKATLLGSYAAIAIENAQLFDQTRHQAQQLTVLNQLAREMTGVLEMKNLCTIVAERIHSTFNYLNVAIFTIDQESQDLVLQSIVGVYDGRIVPGELVSVDKGLIGLAAQTGQVVVVNNTQYHPNFFQLAGPDIRSELAIPLKVGERLLGVMNIDSDQLNAFNESDVATLTTVADQLAVGLEKARLFVETRRRAEQLEALRRLSQDLTTLRDLDTLLRQIGQRAVQLLHGDGVGIYLYRAERQLLELVVSLGKGGGPVGLTLSPGEGFSGKVWASMEPLIVDDYKTWPGKSPRLAHLSLSTIVGVPIQWGDEPLGVLNVHADNTQRHFTPEDASLLAQFATQAAIAIQNWRIYDQTQRYATELESRVAERTFELQALYELAQALGQATQLGDMIRLILLHLYQAIPHDVAASLLVTDTTNTLMIQSQRPLSNTLEGHIQEIMATVLGRPSADKPLEVHRIQSRIEAGAHRPLESLASVMQVPLMIDESPIGLLFVATEQPYQFNQEQRRLLRTIADQAADSIRRLQSLLAAEHQRLESLVVHLPNGVVLLDAEQHIMLANPAAQQCLAALTPAAIGDKLTHLGDQSIETILTSSSLARGENYPVEIMGGSNQAFAIMAEPLAVGPEAGGWLLVIWNNTETRATQERIKEQERLAAVGQLAAGIAHDFNNILTSIIGFAELVRLHPDLPPGVQEDLQRIINQGQRATRLVRQILDFSRQSVTEKRPLNLAPFLKETIKLLERTIPENIRIIQEIEPNPEAYHLNADPAQMQQVLTNLAVNARDAMPGGGELRFQLSSLTLTLGERPPYPDMSPGNWIILIISDTGNGIPTEVLPRIFEPFFTTKEVGKGIGLGLAQVYGIISQHGGFIDVKTELEKGTTFTLYLPALPPLQKTSPQSIEPETLHGSGEVILLVEDNMAVLEVTQAMLKHLGYRVITATNGRQALEVFEQHQSEIALVLTDITMPEMGGVALSQTLRAKYPFTKVVALTGYPLEIVSKDLLSQGIVGWLQKPLSRGELAQIISRSLKIDIKG